MNLTRKSTSFECEGSDKEGVSVRIDGYMGMQELNDQVANKGRKSIDSEHSPVDSVLCGNR